MAARAVTPRAVTPVESLTGQQASSERLTSVGRNMMPGTPWLPSTPRSAGAGSQGQGQVFGVFDDDQRAHTACPGNTSRPLPGRLGVICPGSQYWAPHGGPFSYRQEDTISTTRSCYSKRQAHAKPTFIDARENAITSFGHGLGTGFGSNTTSLRGVEWAHKDTPDNFRTTYNDTMTSLEKPRTPHSPAETCSSAVVYAREWQKHSARLGASIGGASTGDFTAGRPHF